MSRRDGLESGASDTEIVAAALLRQILKQLANGFDPNRSTSVFVQQTTATIPLWVECGPSEDWECRFIFDLPHVHDDGVLEYRVRCERDCLLTGLR